MGRITRDLELFLSTPSGWRATNSSTWQAPCGYEISIHALRVEGDPTGERGCPPTAHFYPHPPGGGRRPKCTKNRMRRCISIHALRVEGDLRPGAAFFCNRHFYPRPPSGGRPARSQSVSVCGAISIHALRVEGDHKAHGFRIAQSIFLSTPSEWRATIGQSFLGLKSMYFYPRPPSGGRPAWRLWMHLRRPLFLSTPSEWRATLGCRPVRGGN